MAKINGSLINGPAQAEHKESFLIELANSCSPKSLSYIIGGVFNITRGPQEKSTDNFNHKWSYVFNKVIKVLDLKEIEMTGRQFTWARHGNNPTYEKLHRVLVITKWEKKFPLFTVEARDRSQSDHVPTVLSTGSSTHVDSAPPFRFERGWFLR